MQKCKKRTKKAKKVHLQRLPVEDGCLQRVVLVGQLQREERPFLADEAQEDLVALPSGQFKKVLFVDPFEVAFVAFDLLASPVGADEDVHMLVGIDVMDEGDDAAVAPFRHGEAGLLPHLSQHTVLGALPFLELAAHAEPFVVVDVVLLLGAVQHEVLVAALQIA